MSKTGSLTIPQTAEINRSIVLAERPKGLPDESTLRLEEAEVPLPGEGQMLLRTIHLSLNPHMRGRMNDAKSYAKPVEIGGVMTGQVGRRRLSRSSPHGDRPDGGFGP